MDQGGVELLLSRQRVQKIGSMDRVIYQEVSRETQKTLIQKACLERHQASIKQTETRFFKEEKHKTTIVSRVAKNMHVGCETFARKHKCLIL